MSNSIIPKQTKELSAEIYIYNIQVLSDYNTTDNHDQSLEEFSLFPKYQAVAMG
jgi:hypothetical protein